jgi:hypothetical protein
MDTEEELSTAIIESYPGLLAIGCRRSMDAL